MRNFDAAMTVEQHIDTLDTPDPALDSMVDQREKMNSQTDDFMADYVERTENVPHLFLPYFVKEVRHARFRLAQDYRATFASAIDSAELPAAQKFSRPYTPRTIDPRGADGLPENVPIAVYRDRTELTRVYCWGELTLEKVFAELTAPRWISDMNRSDFGKRLPDPGCDLRILSPAIHVTNENSNFSSTSANSIWPIPAGEFVYFLRYCTPCYGALIEHHGIGKCGVWNPETEGIG